MTAPPLAGIKVVEVAMWGFVPSAAVVLADWGATVIKVEDAVHGDPMRGLLTGGPSPIKASGAKFMWDLFNRGKRSIGVDLRSERGRDVLYRLVSEADVFLTSVLPEARRRLKIDVDDVRAQNPNIIYARGSGMGPEGPEAERGGYDAAAFWSRSGVAYKVTPPDALISTPMPGPAFGDVTSGMVLAGGIVAALLRRERTGEAAVLDVSLLNSAMWSMMAEVTATNVLGTDAFYIGDRRTVPNPIVAQYRTRDGRFVQLVMLEADRHWPDLCRRIGRPELIDDARFTDMAKRMENSADCVAALEEAFASRTLAEWREALADATGVWAAVQSPGELAEDPQVLANRYLRRLHTGDGEEYPAVANPVRIVGGEDYEPGPAPQHGQQTEDVLLELGYFWEEITALKDAGAVL